MAISKDSICVQVSFLALVILWPTISMSEQEPSIDCDTAEPILIADGVPALCTMQPTDIDSFNFAAAQDDDVRIFLLLGSGAASADPKLEVLDPDGILLHQKQCRDCGKILMDLQNLEKSGLYKMFVSDVDGDAFFGYNLYLVKFQPTISPDPIFSDFGISKNISFASDHDLFSFRTDSARSRVRVILDRENGEPDFRLEIRKPNNRVLFDEECDGCRFEEDLILPSRGQYLISVSDRHEQPFSGYRLFVKCISGNCELEPPKPSLVLPYYSVDMEDRSGRNTKYTVRNTSHLGVTVASYFYSFLDGTSNTPWKVATRFLGANQSETFNIRNEIGSRNVPTTQGRFAEGYVGISIVDPDTSLSTPDQRAIAGDYLVLDFEGSQFAGKLLKVGPFASRPEVCNTWSIGFSKGKPFDKDIDFVFYATSNSNSNTPLVTGDVFDINGEHVKSLSIRTAKYVLLRRFSLGASRGFVEWKFRGNVDGNVFGIAKARSGDVGVIPGACMD